jgi:hypothetical protein
VFLNFTFEVSLFELSPELEICNLKECENKL